MIVCGRRFDDTHLSWNGVAKFGAILAIVSAFVFLTAHSCAAGPNATEYGWCRDHTTTGAEYAECIRAVRVAKKATGED